MKVILFDADGVLINKPRLFTEKFSEEYDVPLEKIEEFFVNEWKDCALGKADTKENLKPYLTKWGWKGSVKKLLEYWHKTEDYTDKRLVKEIKGLRTKGVICCLVTDNDKYRTEYIKSKMGFDKLFDKIFSSCDIGFRKKDREFWQAVYKAFSSISKEEFFLWDDTENNIRVAREFGFQGEVYRSFEEYSNFSRNVG
jgi:putative hydrolase of the HAD superfamily